MIRRGDARDSGGRGVLRRRLAVLAFQLVIAFQSAAFIDVAAPPAPVRAADGCTVSAGAAGGILSSCADAATYADFADALQVGLDTLRGASATSELIVGSNQDGATVTLNGLPAGVTPLDAVLPAGTYLVRVTKDGYAPFSKTVTIDADTPGKLTAGLEPLGGSAGSFEWIRPETLITVANGFHDGGFDITGYVRDKDGVDYVAFTNSKTVEVEFEEPTEMAGYGEWLKSDRDSITMVGVAKSTDDGRTWSLVKTWTGDYSARTWTSERFIDRDWAAGKPGTVKQHWIRAYYHEERKEQYLISSMVPRPTGGVAVHVTKSVSHQPQELMLIWDNLTASYCREDDATDECFRIDHPGRYIGSVKAPFTTSLVADVGSDGTYRRVATPQASDRFGVTPQDLATYNLVRELTTVAYDTGTGAEPQLANISNRVLYQASHDGADYFLEIVPDCCATEGTVWVARAGGPPVIERTYTLGGDGPKGSNRLEQLHVGPDGTIYVLDHIRGHVYVLGADGATLLGSVSPDVYGGIYGPGNPSSNFLSSAVDSGGNVHVAFRVGAYPPGDDDPDRVNVYYEHFPREKVAFESVALFTEPDCPACDAARDWLTAAEIPFRENPTDLPADVAASVGAAQGSEGLPVVARLGQENVVKGGADPGAISRLLGVPYPILVDTHPIKAGRSRDGRIIGWQPEWALLILEADQPRVITQRDEGVVAFSPAAGGWTPQLVMGTPPPAPVDEYNSPDGLTTAYFPRYPIFPGGIATPSYGTNRAAPFNTIESVGDLRFLFRSDSGNTVNRYGYTLHTTKSAPMSSAYRASAQVSQLIPATAFDILLGPKGSASTVRGELAAYVTSEGQATDGSDRFYRVVVDLRAQNETAVDGNLQARAIGGSIQLETEADDGTPETREINLILFVDNTRLRVTSPEPGGSARDISAEAVHFTGTNERWVVTNNLALTNEVPCGADQSVLLPPHSTSTFSAAEVASFELSSCMDALEVAPTVLTGCESWEDAKLVLAAQTIESFGQSLALERTEESTNYELSFGSRDASVRRIVSIDELAGDGPACASELAGATAAVVSVSGTIMGDGEPFTPRITVIDSGREAVRTAPTALPGGLAWEREWLEFEANFLELSLKSSIADEALSSLMFLSTAGKKLGYQRQLLATRALLHCNYEGVEVASVVGLVERSAANPDALRLTAVCLQDFVLNSTEHWPSFDRALWSGGQFQAGFVGTVINSSLAANPTLGFLVAAAKAEPRTYGEFVFARAELLAAKAAANADVANQATDFQLDHLARILTASAREMTGATGAMTKVALMSGPVERAAVSAVLDCARSFGTANPFPKLFELTKLIAYTAGIPCVERQANAEAKVMAYRQLVVGIRSGTFAALLEASGRDLDLLYAHLELIGKIIKDVEAAEARYPIGTSIVRWNEDLTPLDRFVLVRQHAAGVVEARGRQMTVREAAQILAGLTECGAGLVKGLFSGEGILMLGLGVSAAIAGPTAAALGGVAFFVSGVAFTGLASSSLAQMWDSMDLAGKTAGVCGVAASAMMTVVAGRGGYAAVRGWTPKELQFSPPARINLKFTRSRGKAQGAGIDEQADALGRRGGAVAEEPAPVPVPAETSLRAVLDALPHAKQPIIRALAERLDYSRMDVAVRAAFDELARAYGEASGVASLLARRRAKIDEINGRAGNQTAALDPWVRIGGAMALDLVPGRPKSLRVEVTPEGLAGSDAELVLAAADDARFGDMEGSPRRGASEADIRAGTSLTQAFLRSNRAREALSAPSGARALTSEEAAFLARLQKLTRPDVTTFYVASLARTAIIDALREGIAAAQALYGIPAGTKVTAMTADFVAEGVFKSAFRLRVTFAGRAAPVEIAFKKGIITEAEFALLQELGAKGLTQKPFLRSALENVDGNEAISVEEWVPGDGLLQAFGKADAASSAVGGFDALLFLRTVRGAGADARAYYNKDLHWNNMKAYPEGGGMKAKAVDFDPQFKVEATPDQYFAASLMRRYGSFNFAVPSFKAYLQGIVDAFASEPGGSAAAALGLIRKARNNLNDPALRTDVLSIQSFSGTPDIAASVRLVVAEIDGFLASH